MPADLCSDCLKAAMEILDLDGEPGQGVGVTRLSAVFFHDGPQLGPPVERGSAHPDVGGHLREGDPVGVAAKLFASLLDPGDDVIGHCA